MQEIMIPKAIRSFVIAIPVALLLLVTLMVTANFARQHTQINNGLSSGVCQFFMKKLSIAQSIPGPRIVVTGFSNVMMGTNAEALQESLNVPVVNFGANANSSDALVFDALSHAVKPGDAVILELPYWFFSTADRISGQERMIRSVSTSCPVNGLERLSWGYFADFLLFQNPSEIAEGVSRLLFDGWWFEPFHEAPFGKLFGPSGDYQNHVKAARTPKMEELIRSRPMNLKGLKFKHDTDSIHQLERFVAESRERGIAVYAIWPVGYGTVPIVEDVGIVAEMKRLYAELGVPVIGNPDDFRYPLDDFFDSPNHLTREASIRYAPKVARLIRESGLLTSLAH